MAKKIHNKTPRQVSRNQRAVQKLSPTVRYKIGSTFEAVAIATAAKTAKENRYRLKELEKMQKEINSALDKKKKTTRKTQDKK